MNLKLVEPTFPRDKLFTLTLEELSELTNYTEREILVFFHQGLLPALILGHREGTKYPCAFVQDERLQNALKYLYEHP